MSKTGSSGRKNAFAELFQPEVGETRDQIIGKFQAMLQEVKQWKKDGYEHEPENCKPTMVNGEPRGGWISPQTGTCSVCGFYVGSLREEIGQLEIMLQWLREKPPTYRYKMNPQKEPWGE